MPEEFKAYLREIGAGSFRQCSFVVQGWLMTLDNVFDVDLLPEAETMLAFGDDFCGDHYGFLPERDWVVVNWCHVTGEITEEGPSFRAFIRERMELPPAVCKRAGCLPVVLFFVLLTMAVG